METYPWRFKPDRWGMYALFDRSTWSELQPPWPHRKPSPRTLARMIEVPTPDGRPLMYRIGEAVPTDTLIDTIRIGGDDVRRILVRTLNKRPEPQAAVAISELLLDPSPRVRGEAAHAIEHAGSTPFPERLLQAAQSEPNPGALVLQLRALGSIRMVRALAWVTALSAGPSVDDQVRTIAADEADFLRDLESE